MVFLGTFSITPAAWERRKRFLQSVLLVIRLSLVKSSVPTGRILRNSFRIPCAGCGLDLRAGRSFVDAAS